MEMIRKISRGTRMNQIYLPKDKLGFNPGEYVQIKPVPVSDSKPALYTRGNPSLDVIKREIIERVLSFIQSNYNFDNIIFLGSFLDKGYHFNDIDIFIVSDKCSKSFLKSIEKKLKHEHSLDFHLTHFTNEELKKGYSEEPMFELALSRCVSSKRLILNIKRRLVYIKLDMALLESENFALNFDFLSGWNRYKLVRNMIAVFLFLTRKKLTINAIHREISRSLGISYDDIVNHAVIDKKTLFKRYYSMYKKTQTMIFDGKQKETRTANGIKSD